MLLLLACAPVPLTVELPADLPPATATESLPLDRLLVPTPLGAKDDLLCPWMRGETADAAAVERWTNEGRLVMLLVTAGPDGATIAGHALPHRDPTAPSFVSEAAEALRTLNARCGAHRTPDALLAFAPDAPYGLATDALGTLGAAGFDRWWVAVEPGNAVGSAGAARPRVATSDAPKPGDTRSGNATQPGPGMGDAPADGARSGDVSPPPAPTGGAPPLVVTVAPDGGISVVGESAMVHPSEEALRAMAAAVPCAIVSASRASRWRDLVTNADRLLADGTPAVAFAMVLDDAEEGPVAPSIGVPHTGAISALRVDAVGPESRCATSVQPAEEIR
jgi:biopolymer transport protein ExbD